MCSGDESDADLLAGGARGRGRLRGPLPPPPRLGAPDRVAAHGRPRGRARRATGSVHVSLPEGRRPDVRALDDVARLPLSDRAPPRPRSPATAPARGRRRRPGGGPSGPGGPHEYIA